MPDDRPILFSAPMIRALLAGRKTQTRRLAWRVPPYQRRFDDPSAGMTPGKRSPWYSLRPGIRLWVRESFSYAHAVKDDPERRHMGPLWYWADGQPEHGDFSRPKPSIHMPRWASRITLLVTDVRVQRLQEITPEDCDAEVFAGDFPHRVLPHLFPDADEAGGLSLPECFGRLWDSLHGRGAWDANPEVVALTFEVQQRNIDAEPR